MFVRKITVRVKPNMLTQFASTMDKQIVPVLRKQKGFRDQLAIATPGSSELELIGVWDSQADAENYARATYNDVLKMLANIIEGTPKMEGAELLYSTIHETPGKKIAA
jgi:quinol monooxygenase YgiN